MRAPPPAGARGRAWAAAVGRAAVVLAACVAVYGPSLHGDFMIDDGRAIVGNPGVTDPAASLADLLAQDFWGTPIGDPESHKSYRPLTVLTFRAQWHLLQGNSTLSFHAANIALHAAASAAVGSTYVLVAGPEAGALTALLVSLFFALNPLHAEVAASLVGRAESLAALGMLASLRLYLASGRASGRARPAAAALLALAAIAAALLSGLCKEVGFTVFGIMAAYEAFFLLQLHHTLLGLARFAPPPPHAAPSWGRLTAVVVAFLGATAWRLHLNAGPPCFADSYGTNPGARHPSALTRFFTLNYYAALHAWHLVFPNHFCWLRPNDQIPVLESCGDARNLLTLGFYLALGACAAACFGAFGPRAASPRERYLLGLGGMLLVLPHIPSSNLFFSVGFTVAERVLYCPCIGFVFLAATLARMLLRRRPALRWALAGAGAAVLVLYAARGYRASGTWTTGVRMFEHAVEACPGPDNSDGYAIALLEARRGLDEVAAHALRACDPTAAFPKCSALRALAAHHLLELNDTGAGLAWTRRALELDPSIENHLNLGACHRMRGDRLLAKTSYLNALAMSAKRNETHGDALASVCSELVSLDNNPFDAEHGLLFLVQSFPDVARFHLQLGQTLQLRGLAAPAAKHLLRAHRLNASDAVAPAVLGHIHLQLGNLTAAEAFYQQALARDPALVNARVNLGFAALRLGRALDARGHFRLALQLQDDSATAWTGLARACHAASLAPERDSALEALVRLGQAGGAAELRRAFAA